MMDLQIIFILKLTRTCFEIDDKMRLSVVIKHRVSEKNELVSWALPRLMSLAIYGVEVGEVGWLKGAYLLFYSLSHVCLTCIIFYILNSVYIS